jgi:hypothetical protein
MKKLLETNIPFAKLPKYEQKSFLNRYADEWENIFDGELDWEMQQEKIICNKQSFKCLGIKKMNQKIINTGIEKF